MGERQRVNPYVEQNLRLFNAIIETLRYVPSSQYVNAIDAIKEASSIFTAGNMYRLAMNHEAYVSIHMISSDEHCKETSIAFHISDTGLLYWYSRYLILVENNYKWILHARLSGHKAHCLLSHLENTAYAEQALSIWNGLGMTRVGS